MRTALLLVPLLALAAAAPAVAQVRIVGRVIDDTTEWPLSDAQVTVRATDGRFLGRVDTDPAGTFQITVDRVSAVRIDVRRMSYRANSMPLLHFDGRRFFQVEARLAPDAILLVPLEIIAWSEVDMSPFLEGFRQRLRNGLGLYITREQIEARRPTLVADLFRDIPGITVMGSGAGNRARLQVGRSLARTDCETQIYVDGFLMNRRTGLGRSLISDFRLDDAVSPLSVEGIEVYRGLSTVPAEFQSLDARCGVIAIWTRRGGHR